VKATVPDGGVPPFAPVVFMVATRVAVSPGLMVCDDGVRVRVGLGYFTTTDAVLADVEDK
jgi:hypothetical protein